jgi:hypothetical protein
MFEQVCATSAKRAWEFRKTSRLFALTSGELEKQDILSAMYIQ